MLDFLAVGDVMLDIRLPGGSERHGSIASLVAGSAVNAALAAQRLGVRAGVAGAVGSDPVGRMVELELADTGLELFLDRIAGASTGVVVYGEQVVGDRGANAHYVPGELPEARVTLVSGYLSAEARACALELTTGLRAVDLQGVAGVAPGADVVLGPEIDLGGLDGCVVVSTLGADGAVAVRGDERAQARPVRILAETPIGAGDTFAAGFLLALADGRALGEALQAGCDAVVE